MFDTTGKTAIAQLVFFIAAMPLAIYCLIKHGKHGLLGWFFLTTFCAVRIAGSAIIVGAEAAQKPVSEAGLIISSVAIAPLIVSIGGIAHESYLSIASHGRIIFGFFPHVVVHIGSAAAIVLVAMGYTKFGKTGATADDMTTGIDMVRGGVILLLVVWLGIAAIAMVSFLYSRALRGEKQLIGGVVVALVALFVRILYSVLGAFINSASFNPRTGGTTAEKVVLDILPEFIFTLALLGSGVASRNIACERQEDTVSQPKYR